MVSKAFKPAGTWSGMLLIAALFLASFGLRLPHLRDGAGMENLEASYHVLLTMTAMDQSPAAEHHYLPTVSLGQANDKGIAWGVAIPTKAGHEIYTSFLPAGFLVPLTTLKLAGADLSVRNLALFNGMLGLAGALLAFALALRVAEMLAPGRTLNQRDSLLATLPILFSAQALQSTGLIYWHQCLYQLILLATCHSWLSLASPSSGQSKRAATGLIVLAFIGPFFDWTALLVNAAIFLLLATGFASDRRRLGLAAAVAGVTVLSLATTIAHFASLIGAEQFLNTSASRFGARSSTQAVHLLPWGYVKSYGLFLVVFAAAALPVWRRLTKPWPDRGSRAVAGLAVVLVAACFENLILYQHASQFAFDRFKFAIALGMVIVVALPQLDRRKRQWMIGTICAAALVGILTYIAELRFYAPWSPIYASNEQLRGQIDKLVDRRCAVFTSDAHVRGYTNLWLMRGVHEYVTPAMFGQMVAAHPRCGAVYLVSQRFKPDIFLYRAAVVVSPSDAPLHVLLDNFVIVGLSEALDCRKLRGQRVVTLGLLGRADACVADGAAAHPIHGPRCATATHLFSSA